MTNKKKSGSIKVTKTTTGNLNIEGIKFFATGISDTNKDLKFEAVTDENGIALFNKLVIGKYVITEDGSTVPYGYLVADSKQVTVAYAQTVDTDMLNEKVLDTKQAEVYRHSLDSVVQFVVSQRCNLSGKIDLRADVDVSALGLIKNARDMILFSTLPKTRCLKLKKKLSQLTAKTKLLTMPKPQSKKARLIGLMIYSKTL